MEICDCYKVIQNKRKATDFELGYYLGKFGKPMPLEEQTIIENIGYCRGTRDCEECYCRGDKLHCDFYEDVRAKAREELNG